MITSQVLPFQIQAFPVEDRLYILDLLGCGGVNSGDVGSKEPKIGDAMLSNIALA